jgi:hypothetical protein
MELMKILQHLARLGSTTAFVSVSFFCLLAAHWLYTTQGSYAGARAAHMRVLYPEIVFGAIASSGLFSFPSKHFHRLIFHSCYACKHIKLGIHGSHPTSRRPKMFHSSCKRHQFYRLSIIYPLQKGIERSVWPSGFGT